MKLKRFFNNINEKREQKQADLRDNAVLNSVLAVKKQIQDDVDLLETVIKRQNKEIAELDLKKKSLSESFIVFKAEVTKKKEEYISDLDTISDKLKLVKKEQVDAEITLMKTKDAIAAGKELEKAINEELAIAQNRLEALQKEFKERDSVLTTALENLDVAIGERKETIQDLDEKIKSLTMTSDDLTTSVRTLDKTLSKLRETKSDLDDEIGARKRDIEVLKEDALDIAKKLSDNLEEYEKQKKLAAQIAIKENDLVRREKALATRYKYLGIEK